MIVNRRLDGGIDVPRKVDIHENEGTRRTINPVHQKSSSHIVTSGVSDDGRKSSVKSKGRKQEESCSV
jgi:hypothetical protein